MRHFWSPKRDRRLNPVRVLRVHEDVTVRQVPAPRLSYDMGRRHYEGRR